MSGIKLELPPVMNRKAFYSLFCAAVVGTIGIVSAQTVDEENEGTILEYDDANEIYRFKWWGRAGRVYYLQHSEDLAHWGYFPIIEQGEDSVREWGFSTNSDRFFLRLRMLDFEEGDLFAIDSDGDGIPDWWEVMNGLDPFLASDALMDIDGDGLRTLSEFLAGTDPGMATGAGPEASLSGLSVLTPLE